MSKRRFYLYFAPAAASLTRKFVRKPFRYLGGMMNVRSLLLRTVAGTAVLAGATLFPAARLLAQEGLPTLAEAQEISKKTGRPILAMAGQKT